MKHYLPVMPERPAFMKIVDFEQQEINKGYIVRIDEGVKNASIIILKKGGICSMIKTVVKPKADYFENIFNELNYMKENLEAKKQEAIQVAIKEVEAQFEEDAGRIDRAIAEVSITEEIEVPDEIVEETEGETVETY